MRPRYLYALLVAAVLVAVGCGATPDGDPGTNPPPTATDTAPQPARKPVGYGDGEHKVGTDIKPGDYTTTVPVDAFGCYWARVSSFDGELQSINANGNLEPGARGRITVKKSDRGVEFTGGCTWKPAK